MKPDVNAMQFTPWAGEPMDYANFCGTVNKFTWHANAYYDTTGRTDYAIRCRIMRKGVVIGMFDNKMVCDAITKYETELVDYYLEKFKQSALRRATKQKQFNDHAARRHLAYWRDRVPEGVARAQVAFERSERVLRGRNAGLTLREIAKAMNLSSERVRTLEYKALRIRRHPIAVRRGYVKSPVERYFEERPFS